MHLSLETFQRGVAAPLILAPDTTRAASTSRRGGSLTELVLIVHHLPPIGPPPVQRSNLTDGLGRSHA